MAYLQLATSAAVVDVDVADVDARYDSIILSILPLLRPTRQTKNWRNKHLLSVKLNYG